MLIAKLKIFDGVVTGLMKIFFYLDTVIYRIAGWAYKIFYIMGSITLDSDEAISAITTKIYTVLLIFMVFVVAYNMLLYIINPDKINDGSIGATNLVKKIAISLVVIVASPYFFDVLFEVQTHVIEYNVIGTVILGNGGSSGGERTCNVTGIGDSGDALVADVYSAFLYPLSGMMASDCCDGTLSKEEADSDEYCSAYLDARDKGAIGGFSDIMSDAVDENSDYQYLGFASTIAGVAMVVYFLSFCINLGIRLFKLLALELIAPIPALLDLIPGKSGTLSNWFKTVMSVWAQVFVYQAVVFSLVWLATLIPGLIHGISASIDANASGATGGFLLLAKVLIIMALFQACKEVPKMVSDVLGIKGGEGLLKAAGLKTIGMGAFGAGAAALGAASSGLKSYFGSGGGLKGLASGVAGATGALGRNVWGMRNAKNFKDIKASTKGAIDTTQNKRIQRKADWEAYSGGKSGVKGAINVAKGVAARKGRSIMDTVGDTTGYRDAYGKKAAHDKALNEVNDIVKNDIESIWKNDATWSKYENMIKEIESGHKVTYRDATGVHEYTIDQLKREQNARKAKLLENTNNQNKIRAALAEIQALSATHPGMAGLINAGEFERGGKFDKYGTIDGNFVENLENALGISDSMIKDDASAMTDKMWKDLADKADSEGEVVFDGKSYTRDEFYSAVDEIGSKLEERAKGEVLKSRYGSDTTLRGEIKRLGDDKEYQGQKVTIDSNRKLKEAVKNKQKEESSSSNEK